ncbi:MAG: QueT transporter family protein [Clostridiales bacterium]|jgi:uncharacterized membrane protein|nr:QueT transporter family protein [Clostridiales bacterium]
MNNRTAVKKLVVAGMIAAAYTVLTLAPVVKELSFYAVQLRLAEILNLAAFIDPIYGTGVVLGCFISNLASPFGMMDALLGTAATALAVFLIGRTKNLFAASLWPALVNGAIIGAEINFFENVPLGPAWFLNPLLVMAGELAVVTAVGYPVFKFFVLNRVLASKS